MCNWLTVAPNREGFFFVWKIEIPSLNELVVIPTRSSANILDLYPNSSDNPRTHNNLDWTREVPGSEGHGSLVISLSAPFALSPPNIFLRYSEDGGKGQPQSRESRQFWRSLYKL